MANGGGVSQEKSWDRAYSDIEVTKQRITGLENAFVGVNAKLEDISKRLEARPTDIWKVIGGVVAVLALVGGFLWQGKEPLDDNLARHDREISRLVETAVSKDDFKLSLEQQQRRNLAMDAAITKVADESATRTAKVTDEMTAARIALAFASGQEAAWHEQYVKDDARHTNREDTIDSQQIKRPEIEAANVALKEMYTLAAASINERVNSVILSLNELRRDFGASWNIGDALKALETWRNSFTTPPAVPPR